MLHFLIERGDQFAGRQIVERVAAEPNRAVRLGRRPAFRGAAGVEGQANRDAMQPRRQRRRLPQRRSPVGPTSGMRLERRRRRGFRRPRGGPWPARTGRAVRRGRETHRRRRMWRSATAIRRRARRSDKPVRSNRWRNSWLSLSGSKRILPARRRREGDRTVFFEECIATRTGHTKNRPGLKMSRGSSSRFTACISARSPRGAPRCSIASSIPAGIASRSDCLERRWRFLGVR